MQSSAASTGLVMPDDSAGATLYTGGVLQSRTHRKLSSAMYNIGLQQQHGCGYAHMALPPAHARPAPTGEMAN